MNDKQRQDSKTEFLIAQKFDGKAFKNASFLPTFLVFWSKTIWSKQNKKKLINQSTIVLTLPNAWEVLLK
jgi:hypothetical protein